MDVWERVRCREEEARRAGVDDAVKFLEVLNTRLHHPGLFNVNSVCALPGRLRGINAVLVRVGDAVLEITPAAAIEWLREKKRVTEEADSKALSAEMDDSLHFSEPISPEEAGKLGRASILHVPQGTKYVVSGEELFGKGFCLKSGEEGVTESAPEAKEEMTASPHEEPEVESGPPTVSLFKQRLLSKNK
mgnify:CR=1 FL=1